MPDVSDDPLTQTYKELADFLEEQEEFADLFKKRNKTRSDQLDGIPKKQVNNNDFPEWRLFQGNERADPFKTSTGSQLIQEYRLQLVTDKFRVDLVRSINAVYWAVFKSFARTADNLGLSFVTNIQMTGGQRSIEDPDFDKSTPGWTTAVLFTVEMWWDRATLQ